MLSMESVLTPNPMVVGRIVNGEAVLVLPEIGEVKVLNEVGSRIWELSDGTLSINQISTLIFDEFDIDESTAQQDTLEFAEECLGMEIFLLESK